MRFLKYDFLLNKQLGTLYSDVTTVCALLDYTAVHSRPDNVHRAHQTRLSATYRDMGGFLVQLLVGGLVLNLVFA